MYVDDIVIATENWEQYMYWLEVVIKRLTEAGFMINRKKGFNTYKYKITKKFLSTTSAFIF